MKRTTLGSILLAVAALVLTLGATTAFLTWSSGSVPRPDYDIRFVDLGLPDDIHVLDAGTVEPEAISHPLKALTYDEEQAPLSDVALREMLATDDIYRATVLIPEEGVVVGMYSYIFTTEEQVHSVIQGFENQVMQGADVTALGSVGSDDGLYGEQFAIVGAERTYIAWFVGKRETSLLLLMVEGIDAEVVSKRLDMIIEQAVARVSD